MVPDRLVSFQNLMIFWDFSHNTPCRVSLNAQQVITEAYSLKQQKSTLDTTPVS